MRIDGIFVRIDREQIARPYHKVHSSVIVCFRNLIDLIHAVNINADTIHSRAIDDIGWDPNAHCPAVIATVNNGFVVRFIAVGKRALNIQVEIIGNCTPKILYVNYYIKAIYHRCNLLWRKAYRRIVNHQVGLFVRADNYCRVALQRYLVACDFGAGAPTIGKHILKCTFYLNTNRTIVIVVRKIPVQFERVCVQVTCISHVHR